MHSQSAKCTMEVLLELPSHWQNFLFPIVVGSDDSYFVSIRFQLPSFVKSIYQLFVETEPELPQWVTDSRVFIEDGQITLCKEGVGGVYFVNQPDGHPVAVFKPTDEEPGAENNPKKEVLNPLLPPGGGSIREVAAFLLDKDHFAGVPETHLLSGVWHDRFYTNGEKSGSIQKFLENDGTVSSVGCSAFEVEDVHRIGTLDIRIFNLDRNEDNILVKKENDRLRLIPIDHTFCLPPVTSLEKGVFFEWQYWPQAKKPFSKETLDYIASIDIAHDSSILRSLGFCEESIMTMSLSTVLLQEAARAGYTLFEIASFLPSGMPLGKHSLLEDVVAYTKSTGERTDSETFLKSFKEDLSRFLKTAK